jgi:hypothetical protein
MKTSNDQLLAQGPKETHFPIVSSPPHLNSPTPVERQSNSLVENNILEESRKILNNPAVSTAFLRQQEEQLKRYADNVKK